MRLQAVLADGSVIEWIGDVDFFIDSGVLTVYDYPEEPQVEQSNLVFAAAPGFWATIKVVEEIHGETVAAPTESMN